MRIRELQFNRNANWRHRSACAKSKIATREVGYSRHARGHHGELDVRIHCGNLPEMSASATPKTKPSLEFVHAERAAKFILAKTKLRPRVGLVLGSGLGAFAYQLSVGVVCVRQRTY